VPAGKGQGALWTRQAFAELRVIGQLRDSYILCEGRQGLVLVDQHAAHERVVYETLRNRARERTGTGQRLLVPETVEMGHREKAVLEGLVEDFGRMGWELEPFGGNAFLVRSVPALLSGREVAPLLLEVAEKAAALDGAGDPEKALDASLKIMACHGSVRARQPLENRQMRELLRSLDGCENPSHCPHGRPTWIHWEMGELERRFGRKG
jgi:DNA mismatch repair protein MutL